MWLELHTYKLQSDIGITIEPAIPIFDDVSQDFESAKIWHLKKNIITIHILVPSYVASTSLGNVANDILGVIQPCQISK